MTRATRRTPDRHDVGGRDEDIIRGLYPALRRYAGAIHPADMDPDDLLQEAIYRVLRRGTLQDIPYPMAYLRRVMTNLASNHNRSQGRRRKALAKSGHDAHTLPCYPSDVDFITAVEPMAQAIVFMRAIEGRPFAEIAEILGITDTAARTIDSRARRSLRWTLTEETLRSA